jgi:hypothetical protein
MTGAKTAIKRSFLDSGTDFALGEEGGVDMVSPGLKNIWSHGEPTT